MDLILFIVAEVLIVIGATVWVQDIPDYNNS